MIIRKATIKDKDGILEQVREFAASFKTNDLDFEESFNSILKDKHVAIFVADENDIIIGYCLGFVHNTFYANGKVAWLEEIMVDSKYRRKGIGKKLIGAFEDFSKDNKCKLVALATRRASSFYLSTGYEESALYYRKNLQLCIN